MGGEGSPYVLDALAEGDDVCGEGRSSVSMKGDCVGGKGSPERHLPET